MSVTKYNMHGKVEEFIKVAEKALFEAKRCHERLDKQPPKGEKGDSVLGPRGYPGKDGTNGRDGKDGIGCEGRHGINGRDGKDGSPGPDTAVVLAEARSEIAAMCTRFEALQQDFETLSLAFTSSNKKTSEYLQWLKSRVAARLAEMKEKNGK